MTSAITHIIFDCDGVLVDSETLSAQVLSALMAELGFTITDEIFNADFLGRSFASAAARAVARFGRPLPDDVQMIYRQRLQVELRKNLKAMAGVTDVLDALRCPFGLATSSSPQRLEASLSVTGLTEYFAGRCSTASEVLHGKPAPDLLFLAAKRLAAKPENCLVLEDSLMGIEAGLAAGMTVWRFMGGSHMRAADVATTPATVRRIANMTELQRALGALGLCHAPELG